MDESQVGRVGGDEDWEGAREGREGQRTASSKCRPSGASPRSRRSARAKDKGRGVSRANDKVSEDEWDSGPGPSSSVAPPRRAGGLRSEGEGSDSEEDWGVEHPDGGDLSNSEAERTGRDEAEAASGDLVDLPGESGVSAGVNEGSSSNHSDAHALLGETAQQGNDDEYGYTDSDGSIGGSGGKLRTSLPCTAKTTDQQSVSTCRHKRIPTIYKITSPSGKSYVGQTVWPTSRMSKHKNGGNRCTALATDGEKYGWDNMQWEVLRGGPGAVGGAVAEAELDGLEVFYIESEGTLAPNGYNLQKGGNVAWRGVDGLARHGTRGPRTEETKQALRDAWETKREARLSGMDEEKARRLRNHAMKQSESRRAKQAGMFEDGRFESSAARTATWNAKREAKLALLPPEVAAKKRADSDRWRANAMRHYNRKKGRV